MPSQVPVSPADTGHIEVLGVAKVQQKIDCSKVANSGTVLGPIDATNAGDGARIGETAVCNAADAAGYVSGIGVGLRAGELVGVLIAFVMIKEGGLLTKLAGLVVALACAIIFIVQLYQGFHGLSRISIL